MSKFANSVGVKVPELMMPKAGIDMKKWAVVACDQFTSQPDYWEKAEDFVGSAPSTLRLMLPEMYLDKPGEAERINDINACMNEYVKNGTLASIGKGLMLVSRTVDGKTRTGLIVALDLEAYDYKKGSATLIRASEGTIVERIPPRLRIRKDAPLELPHILVLIDDPECTVIEPLKALANDNNISYDTELMLGGGHISGHFISDEKVIENVLKALAMLADKDAFSKKYDETKAPMLFAMGDGNHSFATAKANWEALKPTLSDAQRETHPARYALVELENVHDEGIVFEPIHRVLFNVNVAKAEEFLMKQFRANNGGAEYMQFKNEAECELAMNKALADDKDEHILPVITSEGPGFFRVHKPVQQLPVGTLQQALDALIKEFDASSIDYIHGADVVKELGAKEKSMGFLLPPMDKGDFFRTVVYDGALPRKTFSMGEAHEKRYYLECRKIK